MDGMNDSENMQGLATEPSVGAWKTGVLLSLLSEHHPKDILNADDHTLFFNLLLDKTCFRK
jgi:hypothetical protein